MLGFGYRYTLIKFVAIFIALFALFFLVSSCSSIYEPSRKLNTVAGIEVGDREPKTKVVYPLSAFFHNGGRVIDVTKPPFNAYGDGKHDDTAAIIEVYDFIVESIRKRLHDGDYWPIADSYIIYFPNGTYLISDTIDYSGEALVYRKYGQSEGLNNIRFQGESREETIIKLKDNSEGFNLKKIKPVISLSRRADNNLQTFNSVENLTISTGRQNPYAVAINHAGANKTSLRNLLISSNDGQGVAGIYINTSPTQGYHTDITIKGFNHGIWMVPYHVTHNSFEYVTLLNQNKASIVLDNSTTSLRAIRVLNRNASAILQRGPGSQVSILDSALVTTKKQTPAIQRLAGSLFMRNIATKHLNETTREFTYPKQISHTNSDKAILAKSLNLAVEDEPLIQFPSEENEWAEIDDFLTEEEAKQVRPDYHKALQAALNSGKRFVLFAKQQSYYISKPVSVPSTVKVINGLHSIINMPTLDSEPLFIVDQFTEEPLTVENMHINGNGFSHRVLRPLAIRNLGTRGSSPYNNDNKESGAKLFLTVVSNFGRVEGTIRDQKVWARWINTESPFTANFPIVNTDMWVLGYKTEKFQSSFTAKRGSQLEVIGGVSNQFYQANFAEVLQQNNGISPYPIFYIEDSNATIFACTNGPSKDRIDNYDSLIKVANKNVEWEFRKQSAPERIGRKNQVFIPLFNLNLFNSGAD
jgi:hypothetical protein